MTEKSEKSTVKNKLHFIPLSSFFFKKIDRKFGIYGLENPPSQKISKIDHEVNEIPMTLSLNKRFLLI